MSIAAPANINDDLPAVAAANPAGEEDAIETIAVPNNNDIESAAVSTDADSSISSSSNAAEDAGQQRTTNRFVKRGGSLVVAAAALAVIGAGSVHLAGRPTTNFSSSKQVAVSSGDIKIKKFMKVGNGECRDEPGGIAGGGNPYDFVIYGVESVKACSKKCSVCPGGGQTDDDGVELVLRGFEYFDGGGCFCLVDDVAEGELTKSVCEGAVDAFDGFEGSGEIESSSGDDGVECWKIKSKSSKSPKSGSKGGKRG